MNLKRCSLALAVAGSLGWAVAADEFVLKDGRALRGAVRSERPAEGTKDKQFTVELAPGVMVLINGREIKQHTRGSGPEQEYVELMKKGEDTAEFHLKAASWCHKNGLKHHEVAHYERVLDLEPENRVARVGLNYTEGKDGRWIKRDVLMTEGRGKVRDGGKFRFPEIVALEEAQDEANQQRIKLLNEIRRWQRDVLTENNKRAPDSLAKLQALDGPLASAALAELLFPRTNSPMSPGQPPEAMRKLYVAVLARLADPAAVQTLVRMALTDSERDIRNAALEALRTVAPQAATLAFIQALRSDKPVQINAAGRALAVMSDESSILPLIEHVVTIHRTVTPGDNRTNAGFNNAGGGGQFAFGGTAPKVSNQLSQNDGVLAALTTITGQNLGYDKDAWLAWYQQNYFGSGRDLRRDQ